MINQRQRVLAFLETAPSGLTSHEAEKKLACARLAARVSELRGLGHPIQDKWIYMRNRYGQKVKIKRYFIDKADLT